MPPPEEAADEIAELLKRVDGAVQRMTDASAAHAAIAAGREANLEPPPELHPPEMQPPEMEDLSSGFQMPPPPPVPPPFSMPVDPGLIAKTADLNDAFSKPPDVGRRIKDESKEELPWAPLLRTAWIEYCAATPTELREIPGFLKPVTPAAILYRNLHGTSSHRRGGAGSSGGMAPAPQVDPGPQPDAVRILMPKYGLNAGSVHRVLGASKLTWKLVGAKAVPFHHEGLGWERAPASALEEQPLEPGEQPMLPGITHAAGSETMQETGEAQWGTKRPRLA